MCGAAAAETAAAETAETAAAAAADAAWYADQSNTSRRIFNSGREIINPVVQCELCC